MHDFKYGRPLVDWLKRFDPFGDGNGHNLIRDMHGRDRKSMALTAMERYAPEALEFEAL